MSIREWSIRHSLLMKAIYQLVKAVFILLHPLLQRIGYHRAEKPMVFVEKHLKGFLFDCQMCGHCILSETGMSCPMNCPKDLRNGPCGGVRANGNCEVKPEMTCVWVQAWEGCQTPSQQQAILEVQPPVDSRDIGTSAWLRMTQKAVAKPLKKKQS